MEIGSSVLEELFYTHKKQFIILVIHIDIKGSFGKEIFSFLKNKKKGWSLKCVFLF